MYNNPGAVLIKYVNVLPDSMKESAGMINEISVRAFKHYHTLQVSDI
jgi:hypothetical protein